MLNDVEEFDGYDLCFIGTAHSDRLFVIDAIEAECKLKGYRFIYYLYSPSKLLFYLSQLYYFFLKRRFAASKSKVRFKSLPKHEVANIIAKSKIIVDIEHPAQCGLTMRTFEVLASKKKLLTTNHNILDYSFYSENNIFVFDRLKTLIPEEFVSSKFECIDECFSRYSLQSWLETIFQPGELKRTKLKR